MNRLWTGMMVCAWIFAGWSFARAGTPTKIKRGTSKVTWTERSPHSNLDVMAKRLEWPRAKMGVDYDISKETFAYFVGNSYNPDTPPGLFVWISSGKGTGVPCHCMLN